MLKCLYILLIGLVQKVSPFLGHHVHVPIFRWRGSGRVSAGRPDTLVGLRAPWFWLWFLCGVWGTPFTLRSAQAWIITPRVMASKRGLQAPALFSINWWNKDIEGQREVANATHTHTRKWLHVGLLSGNTAWVHLWGRNRLGSKHYFPISHQWVILRCMNFILGFFLNQWHSFNWEKQNAEECVQYAAICVPKEGRIIPIYEKCCQRGHKKPMTAAASGKGNWVARGSVEGRHFFQSWLEDISLLIGKTEEGRKRERDFSVRKKRLLIVRAPTRGWTCNPGMCPDQKPNLQLFGIRDDIPTNWATWPWWKTFKSTF